MIKFYKAFAGVFSLFILFLLGLTLYVQYLLPDYFYVAQGEEFYINPKLSLTGAAVPASVSPVVTGKDGNLYSVRLKMFNALAVKQVQVQVMNRRMVVPGGFPFGIKLHTKGVLVVGMSDIQNGSKNVNPAKEAGLKVGDIVIEIDGREISRNSDVAKLISASEGREMSVLAIRGETQMQLSLTPVISEYDNCYKAGMWVRDSSAGIGTMTYYDPETMGFGGLGHAVCDVDTGEIMPLFSGEIVDVNISGVHAGQSGKPGELKGSFANDNVLGSLYSNSPSGIFGILDYPVIDAQPVPMALRQEIHPGPASILVTVSGNKPQSFDIEIEKVNYSDTTPTKNMVIRVVDQSLLALSGGIVQGMSGSPILQDNRLVGAVTHVFVNDPSRGYGIFAENMEKILINVEKERIVA